MSAWSRSGREDATNRALSLLDNMEDLWKVGDGDVRPSQAAYNAALNALYNLATEKSACKAESLLPRMEELFRSGDGKYGDMRPDATSYTSVMNACSEGGSESSAADGRADYESHEGPLGRWKCGRGTRYSRV